MNGNRKILYFIPAVITLRLKNKNHFGFGSYEGFNWCL